MSEPRTPAAVTDLLLACARIELDPASRQHIAQLLDLDINWEHLVAVAVRQGIATLVFSHLRALHAETVVTPAAWAKLETVYLSASTMAMRQRAEVRRLLDALETSGTQVIALKGLHLGEVVYPDPALRPCNDVDLLARADDVPRIERALESLGYRPDERDRSRAWYHESVVQHLVPYVLPGRNVMVEVHWHLAAPQGGFSIDIEGLWARAGEMAIAGRQIGALAPVDLLLYLALHVSGVHRFWIDLRHLVDIAEVARRYEGQLAWEEVASRAVDWRARRHVYVAFALARELVGAPFPDHLLEALHPEPTDRRYMTLARRRITGDEAGESILPGGLPTPGTESRQGERLSTVLRGVFPSPRQMARIYRARPGSLSMYGCYLLRPILLLVQHRLLVSRLLLGASQHRRDLLSRVEDMELDEWLDSASQ